VPTKVGTYQQQANAQIIDPAGHRRAIDPVVANLGWRFAFMPTKVGIYQQRVIAGQ